MDAGAKKSAVGNGGGGGKGRVSPLTFGNQRRGGRISKGGQRRAATGLKRATHITAQKEFVAYTWCDGWAVISETEPVSFMKIVD